MNQIKQLKDEIRSKVKNLKLKIFENNLEKYTEFSNLIIKNIENLDLYKKSKNIGFFAPKVVNFEPNITSLIKNSIKSGKNIFLPRCIKDSNGNNNLEFIQIFNFDEDLEIGMFSLLEPKKSLKENTNYNEINVLKSLDILFIPGLAFDIYGNRIGYGPGYYDNFIRKLKNYNYKVILIGISFDFQISTEKLPNNLNDYKVNYLITQSNFYKFN